MIKLLGLFNLITYICDELKQSNMKQSYLKTNITQEREVVDTETGEMYTEIKQHKYLASTKEEFFIIYTTLLGVFQKMTHPEIKVYCYLLQNYIIGSDICITRQMRINMGKLLELGERTIANTLTTLNQKHLIYSLSRSIYKLNPRYAFQGSTTNRNQALKMVLELECKDC